MLQSFLSRFSICTWLVALWHPWCAFGRGLESIQVPVGFQVEEAAGPPETLRPLMGGFDEHGRLYLAESAGVNMEAEELLEMRPNFVRRLVDSDGDGRFETSTVFADKMTFPMGALPYRGSVYVASPPYIWRLTDHDGDGVCDTREVVLGQFGFIGNAADIHGCFLGPNGRLYWCDGRHGHEFRDASGEIVSKGHAARIFSARLDGSDPLSHCGGGMDNPVEVDFSPQGEMLGVVNLFYQKRGDCLVHWLWGGVYPRADQPMQLAEFKRTGDLLGPVHDFGHVAVSGMLRYRGNSLVASSDVNSDTQTYFVCEFNTHKVLRVVVERVGSSFAARVEDFLVSSDPDFHPTDVIEDADGSLLVVDTGGWFRHGCPTSIEAKPEVTGAIYRVRRRDAFSPQDPRGLELAWEDAPTEALIDRLDDPRPAVSERALDTLAVRGDDAVNPLIASLQSPSSTQASLLSVWALARIGSPAAVFGIVQSGLQQETDTRQAAIVALQTAEIPEALLPAAFAELYKAIRCGHKPTEREAATTLGRIGQPEAVPILLESLEAVGFDRAMEHAILFALVELNDPARTRSGLAHRSTQVRRGALIALDQMDSGDLQRDEVLALLDTGDLSLQQVAMDIIAKHPNWAKEVLGLVRSWMTSEPLDEEKGSMLRGALIAFGDGDEAQSLVGDLLMQDLSPAARKLLLDVVLECDSEELPANWKAGLERALADSDEEIALTGLFASTKYPELRASVARLLIDPKRSEAISRAASLALARMGGAIDETCFEVLRTQLTDGETALHRRDSAEALNCAKLTDEQKLALVDAVRVAGPVELPALAQIFEREPIVLEAGMALVEALRESPGLNGLSAQRISELFSKYPESLQREAMGLIAAVDANRQERVAMANHLESLLEQGDSTRGRAVFAGTRGACASCHTVSGEGGRIGPDLTRIAAIREPRVLIESILFPSESMARGFESYSILTSDGRVMSGLISRESAEAIWLRTEARSEIKIDRADVEEITTSARSIMPEGLDRVLTQQEMIDLVAYLTTLK